jgi:hypothetical protein
MLEKSLGIGDIRLSVYHRCRAISQALDRSR